MIDQKISQTNNKIEEFIKTNNLHEVIDFEILNEDDEMILTLIDVKNTYHEISQSDYVKKFPKSQTIIDIFYLSFPDKKCFLNFMTVDEILDM